MLQGELSAARLTEGIKTQTYLHTQGDSAAGLRILTANPGVTYIVTPGSVLAFYALGVSPFFGSLCFLPSGVTI